MTVILIDASIISVLFCQGRGIARTEQIAERERERERGSANTSVLALIFTLFNYKLQPPSPSECCWSSSNSHNSQVIKEQATSRIFLLCSGYKHEQKQTNSVSPSLLSSGHPKEGQQTRDPHEFVLQSQNQRVLHIHLVTYFWPDI